MLSDLLSSTGQKRPALYTCTDPRQSLQMDDSEWSNEKPSDISAPLHLGAASGILLQQPTSGGGKVRLNDRMQLLRTQKWKRKSILSSSEKSSPYSVGLVNEEDSAFVGSSGPDYSNSYFTDCCHPSAIDRNVQGKYKAIELKGSRWCCIVRLLQLVLVSLLFYVMYSLFSIKDPWKLVKEKPLYLSQSPNINLRRPLGKAVDYELEFNARSHIMEQNRPNWARVQYAPVSMCINFAGSLPKIVILVHSKPGNLIQRNTIRNTWGGIKKLQDGSLVELLFIIGKLRLFESDENVYFEGETDEEHVLENKITNRERGEEVIDNLVYGESVRHQDILIGNFLDTYNNLTIKHELAIRWVTQNCPMSSVILKADDDAFIDIYGLFAYLNRTLGDYSHQSILACDVIPEGTAPQRAGKWAVTVAQYPEDRYPRYCSGLAYVMSMNVAKSLASKVKTENWLWIDDVWMTGVLAKDLNIKYIFLNARYCYDLAPIDNWLERATPSSSPPCTIAHLDTASSNYEFLLRKLWQHCLPKS